MIIFCLIIYGLFHFSLLIVFIYYFNLIVLINDEIKNDINKEEEEIKRFEKFQENYHVQCPKNLNKALEKVAHKFYYNQDLTALQEYIFSIDRVKFLTQENLSKYFIRHNSPCDYEYQFLLNTISIYMYHFQENGYMESRCDLEIKHSILFWNLGCSYYRTQSNEDHSIRSLYSWQRYLYRS